MRATTQLVLVLMGGGALTAGTAMSMESNRACHDARSRADPQADRICHSWTTGWHGGGMHGGYGGSHGVTAGASVSGVSRGGFGLMGLHFGGFHS